METTIFGLWTIDWDWFVDLWPLHSSSVQRPFGFQVFQAGRIFQRITGSSGRPSFCPVRYRRNCDSAGARPVALPSFTMQRERAGFGWVVRLNKSPYIKTVIHKAALADNKCATDQKYFRFFRTKNISDLENKKKIVKKYFL